MLHFQDNSQYYSDSGSFDCFSSLRDIANCDISQLSANTNNQLILYPFASASLSSFNSGQNLFSIHTHKWINNNCTQFALQTSNIAGFFSYDDFEITIHSRFSSPNNDDFFLHYLLEKTLGLNLINLKHSFQIESSLDLLVLLFPHLLDIALRQGLYKEYRKFYKNNSTLKGPIDFNRHIKFNTPFNGNIAYNIREHSQNNSLIHLIRHTIEYVRQLSFGNALLTKDADTIKNIGTIIAATPDFKKADLFKIIQQNRRRRIHPYFTKYTSLQTLCLNILRHNRIYYSSGTNNYIYGVLFDVSVLWEEYLNSILKSNGFKHPNNRTKSDHLYLTSECRFPRYPDFHSVDSKRIVIDAKYKRDIKNKRDIDTRNDINQMITYMYRLRSNRGVLIHPTNQEQSPECYHLLGYGTDNNATIEIYPFFIPASASDFQDFRRQITDSEAALVSFLQ